MVSVSDPLSDGRRFRVLTFADQRRVLQGPPLLFECPYACAAPGLLFRCALSGIPAGEPSCGRMVV